MGEVQELKSKHSSIESVLTDITASLSTLNATIGKMSVDKSAAASNGGSGIGTGGGGGGSGRAGSEQEGASGGGGGISIPGFGGRGPATCNCCGGCVTASLAAGKYPASLFPPNLVPVCSTCHISSFLSVSASSSASVSPCLCLPVAAAVSVCTCVCLHRYAYLRLCLCLDYVSVSVSVVPLVSCDDNLSCANATFPCLPLS